MRASLDLIGHPLELARALGWEFRVESKPGVGSTFTLWLPVARSDGRCSSPA